MNISMCSNFLSWLTILNFFVSNQFFVYGTHRQVWVFDAGIEPGEEMKESFLDVELKTKDVKLESFGLCLRVLLDEIFPQSVFEVPGLKLAMNEININYGYLRLHDELRYYIFKYPNSDYLVPEQWYHICVSYNRTHDTMATLNMYLDGRNVIKRDIETPNTTFVLNLTSSWRLGLCKNNVFEYGPQTFRGQLSDLNIWSRPLTDDAMRQFTGHCQNAVTANNDIPDVLHWDEIEVLDRGKFVSKSPSDLECKPKCQNMANEEIECDKHTTTLTFPTKTTFKEAITTCGQLGGSMTLPTNMHDLLDLNNSVNQRIIGSDKTECNTTWIPLYLVDGDKSSSEETLKFSLPFQKNIGALSSKEVFLPWQIGQPNGLGYQKCIVYTTFGTPKYFDVECTERHCFYCSVQPRLYFTLRGLSLKSSKQDNYKNGIDSSYIYIPESQYHEGIILEGYYDHTIRRNSENQNWEIISWKGNNETLIGVLNENLNYPFGKHVWRLKSTYKVLSSFKEERDAQKKVLKLSLVSSY